MTKKDHCRDDEVRIEDIVQEITYHLNQARCIERRTVGNHELASRIFENLSMRGYIRAATAPKNTDAQKAAAWEWLQNNFGRGKTIYEGHPLQVIEQALRAPAAVPQEVVDAINKAADRKNYTWTKEYVGYRDFENDGAISLAKNLQALLQQKGETP
jgi:hypothetical protein